MTPSPQIHVAKHTKSFWTATLDHPPINLIDPDTIRELDMLVRELETDPDVTVVVFDSADPEYFAAHYDVMIDLHLTLDMPNGPTGMHPWIDVLARLSRVPVVTIAKVRGRARAAGSELILACDIRFASVEKALIGQPEVSMGAVPGGGPMARLSRLIGRGRALEVLLGADDFSGELAERYGYVNRAMPDAELDAFVDAFARRIAGFEKSAVAETKTFVDQATLADDDVFPPAMNAFFRSAQRPETGARVGALVEEGFQIRNDVEARLAYHLGEYVKA